MGIDATIYAEGDLTYNMDSPFGPFEYDEEEKRVYADTFERYFSESYPRGNWPNIYTLIRQLGATYPKARIMYGGDGRYMTECTPEYLESLWKVYLRT